MQPPELTAWLRHPTDYAVGVALHAQLGGRALYQHLFAAGETSYSRQVLVRELQGLATMEPAAGHRQATSRLQGGHILAPVLSATAPQPTPPSDPVALADVQSQLKACRDERSQLHAQLSAPRLSRTDRRKLALRICLLTDQVQQLLLAEAHVLEHGRLPGPVATADVTDTGELRRRLDNLISLRAKVRKRPERAGELPALEAEIQIIRLKL